MENKVLVSVVIPTYGRSEMLERAIFSVLKQTYNNIEIIVIDDNGIDTEDQKYTESVLASYINNKKIIYLKHENNAGGCTARNTGIKASNGKYIGFLDDDDEWLPEFTSKHLEKLLNGADVVYCNFFSTEDPLRKEKRKMHTENKTGYVFNDLLIGWCPDTTSMFMINKECFSTSGYFDESLQSFQDYDMWLSMAQNYKFDYCEEYLVVKYQHGFEQLARNPVKRQQALDTLVKKWNKSLTIKESKVFNKTIKKFQKNIYYHELCKLRENRKYIKSIKKFIEIVKLNNSNSRYLLRLLAIIIFDENFIYKLQKLKAKIVKIER